MRLRYFALILALFFFEPRLKRNVNQHLKSRPVGEGGPTGHQKRSRRRVRARLAGGIFPTEWKSSKWRLLLSDYYSFDNPPTNQERDLADRTPGPECAECSRNTGILWRDFAAIAGQNFGRKRSAMKNERGKPFAPGNRIGRGRPKGSPNKAKPQEDPGKALLEWSREALMRKCIAWPIKAI